MQTLIRKLESFGPLSEEDKALIHEIAVRRRKISSRTDIIAEGDEPSDVHLITSGFACRYKFVEGGKRQIMAYLLPGHFCDLHVFILKAMDHGIATLSQCTVVDIPRASILQLLERPAIAKALFMATLVDEGTLREWIVNLGQRRAEERIAHLFCELHARLEVVGLCHGDAFDLPVTQIELADTVGLSAVHINRCLQELRDQGLIALKSGKLHLPDVRRLKKLSGFRPNYLHLARDNTSESPGGALERAPGEADLTGGP